MKKTAFAGCAALLFFAASPALAQGTAPAPRVGAFQVQKISVREFAQRLGRLAGAVVVADRTVASAQITFDSSGGPLDAVLEAAAAALPRGAVVRKAMLPAFRPGVVPDGDRIAALIQAQDDLVAPISGPTKPGPSDLVVLGRVVPADRRAAVTASLDLKPVYLLTNPDAAGDLVAQMGKMQEEMLKKLSAMSPEQQGAFYEQQFDNLMNMDPALRRAMIQQQMQAATGMMQRIQKMSPDQQKQFLDDIRSALPPGFGAGAPGRPGPR